MANDQGDEGRREFDLEERTALFGEAVIKFAKRIPINEVTRSLIGQLVRAGTSVGANYVEADDASTKKEFLRLRHSFAIWQFAIRTSALATHARMNKPADFRPRALASSRSLHLSRPMSQRAFYFFCRDLPAFPAAAPWPCLMAAWAAARRAIGTRKGLQLT